VFDDPAVQVGGESPGVGTPQALSSRGASAATGPCPPAPVAPRGVRSCVKGVDIAHLVFHGESRQGDERGVPGFFREAVDRGEGGRRPPGRSWRYTTRPLETVTLRRSRLESQLEHDVKPLQFDDPEFVRGPPALALRAPMDGPVGVDPGRRNRASPAISL